MTRPGRRQREHRIRDAAVAVRLLAAASLERLLETPHLRGEIGWVIVNKGAEFALVFALLKILTNGLGKAGFGEFNLAETSLLLVSSVAIMPVAQSFLRDYHGSAERGERRAAGIFLIRWYAVVTVGVALMAGFLSPRLAREFEVSRWTPLAAGLLFFFERWRMLGQEVLNIQRRRRGWALYNLGYSACLMAAIAVVVRLGFGTATFALLAYACVAGVFAVLVAGPLVRDILREERGSSSSLPQMAIAFGVPFGLLLVFQWVQGFGDRYLVKVLLDAESVGLYVAAYQVCGIPYSLALRVSYDLLTPIAYQRSRDVDDPAQLWAADRLLISGIAIQLFVGIPMLGLYAIFGQRLLVLLTNEHYVLPAATLTVLAGARFAQSLSQATQPIFAVHHRIGTMLWFRLFGATMAFGICFVMISRYGIPGASIGTFAALSLYLMALVFGPRGCWWLVMDARRRARQAPVSALD